MKTDTLDTVDGRIAEAVAALAGARHAARRSPSAGNLLVQEMAEQAVGELLELRHEMTTAAH